MNAARAAVGGLDLCSEAAGLVQRTSGRRSGGRGGTALRGGARDCLCVDSNVGELEEESRRDRRCSRAGSVGNGLKAHFRGPQFTSFLISEQNTPLPPTSLLRRFRFPGEKPGVVLKTEQIDSLPPEKSLED